MQNFYAAYKKIEKILYKVQSITAVKCRHNPFNRKYDFWPVCTTSVTDYSHNQSIAICLHTKKERSSLNSNGSISRLSLLLLKFIDTALIQTCMALLNNYSYQNSVARVLDQKVSFST